MRRDIRMVVGLLGDALVRQEGQEVLDLVERVRSGSRQDRSPPPGFWTASTSNRRRDWCGRSSPTSGWPT